MIDLLNRENIPEGHFSCKNCAYAKQRALFEKLNTNFQDIGHIWIKG